jgi:hypothetical protein
MSTGAKYASIYITLSKIPLGKRAIEKLLKAAACAQKTEMKFRFK